MEHWLPVGCPAAPSWKGGLLGPVTETLFGSFGSCRGVKCAEWALWVINTGRVGLGLLCVVFFLVCLNLWGLHFHVFTATRMNRRGLWRLNATSVTPVCQLVAWAGHHSHRAHRKLAALAVLAWQTRAGDCHGMERICLRRTSSLKRKQRVLQPVQWGDNCAWVLALPVVCVQIKTWIFSCAAQGKRAALKE